MKKIYLVAVLMMTTMVVFGQQVERDPVQAPYQPKKVEFVNAVPNPQLPEWNHPLPQARSGKSAPQTPYWVNFVEATDDFYGGTGASGSPPIFQDSLPVLTTGDGLDIFNWWMHGIGQIFQPSSLYYANQSEVATIDNEGNVEWFTPQHSFLVDSLRVHYWYERKNPDTTVVDTLKIWVMNNSQIDLGANGFGYFFADWPNPGDTVRGVSMINYNWVTNEPTMGTLYNFPLTHNDGDSLLQFQDIYLGWTLPVNTATIENAIGMAVQYRSGQSYSLGDTLVEQSGMYTVYNPINTLSVLTWEEVSGAYPLSPLDNMSFNHGMILPMAVRYNTTTTWNDLYIPTVAYVDAFTYEHLYIDWNVTPIGANFNWTETGLAVTFNEDCNFTPDTWSWTVSDTGGTQFNYSGASVNHTFAQPGTFPVTLQATNTGTSEQYEVTKNVTVEWPVGYRDFSSNFSVNMFPNPAQNAVNISINANSAQDLEVSIVDLVGKVMFNENVYTSAYRQKLDVSNFANGIYFVNVKSGDNVTSHKLVLAK